MEDGITRVIRKMNLRIVGIWFALRFLTSLTAAIASPLSPAMRINQGIALWPPTGSFFAWLNRILIQPWASYDAIWYEQILCRGYAAWDGSTSFHPLYIWLSTPLYRLGVEALVSLMITSTLATLIFLGILYRLARLDHEPAIAWTAVLLVATFPVSFVLFAPYTESLFLLWVAAALYAMRRNRWGFAALFSFLATLTRQQGLFLVLPLAWELWEASGKSLQGLSRSWRTWLTALAAPAGLISWGIYRIGYLHEGSLDFSSLQGFIYSALLSPSAGKVIPGQAFHWPWQAFMISWSTTMHDPEVYSFINLILGVIFLIAFIVAWKHLGIAERLYSAAIVIASFSVTTGDHAYLSLPRHLLLALPVFFGLAVALQKSWQRYLLITCQILGMIFLIYGYVLNGWIP